uniref:Ycf2 n=1 Tax=Bazzania praerupta TaxID=2575587 RepID=A0A4Y5P7M1_9MARC|nr:Ycf2 [Bazzania praerupta]QCW58996.1 Ycf2 [Bazzania praerupta]
MKQELPEKEISYKNLYLGEIRKTKILSNSWAKCSLIRSLITKFFNKKNLVSSFDFQMIILSINSYYSRKNKNFISNSLMLFASLVSISMYRSNTMNIVEKKNFGLTKVQKQDHCRKDYMDIYKKSFRDFNKNFVDTFSHNIFERRELSKHKSIFEIITHHNNQIFFEETAYSVEREKNELRYGSNFCRKFLDFYLFARETKNQDYFWVRKEILQNLQNWGESYEILVKSSFLLKEKGNLYLSNYLKIYIWEFLTNKSRYWRRRIKSDILTGETLEYSYNKLNNPNLCISLENILSYAIYKFSGHLVYTARESELQVKNTNFLAKQKNKDIDLLDSSTIKKNVRINPQFLNFISPNQLSNLQIDFSNSQWITKILYLNDRAVSKAIFIKRTFLNKSLSSLEKKVDSYVNLLINPLIDKYIINNVFSRQSQEKNRKFLFFSKPSLMAEVTQNILSKEKLNKISKKFRRIDQLETSIQSDDIGIISWKIHKYHSNLSLNYLLPPNHVYSIICENLSSNKGVRYEMGKKSNQLFVRISKLSLLFIRFKKIFSWVGPTELGKNLGIKTNELTILIDQFNQIGDLHFTKKILLLSGDNNGTSNIKNGLIKHYLLIKNFIANNSRNSNELLNNLPFRLSNPEETHINNIWHKYSRLWKINFRRSFIYNIGDTKYNKLGFRLSHWLYEMEKDLSNIVAPYKFSIELESIQILKKYFQDSDSDNINKIFNPLHISTNICSINMERNRLFNQTLVKNFRFIQNEINNLIADLFIDGMNDEIIIDLLIKSSTKKNVSLDSIKNGNLFLHYNYKLDFGNSPINFRSNYREIFSFCSKGNDNDIENNSIIYLQFLKNFLKYNRLNPIFIKQRVPFFEISGNESDKTKFLFFSDSRDKVSEQDTPYFSTNPKIYFSEREKKEIGTLSTKSKIGIKGICKNVLRNLDDRKIENYYSRLQFESLTKSLKINGSIFQAINEIVISPRLQYSKSRDSKYKFGNKMLTYPNKIYDKDKSNQIEIFDSSRKEISFEDYNNTSWFFTYEWWEYNVHIFTETLQERLVRTGSYFEYLINNNIKFIGKTLTNLYGEGRNLYILNSKWNSRLFFDHTEKIILNFVGSDFQSINNFNNVYWAISILMAFLLLFYKNYFSILTGSDPIDLRKNCENIKYLTDTSRAFYFTELSNRNKIQLDKAENLFNFFSNLKHYARNIRFYLLTKKNLNEWLISNKSLDRSRRKRNLLVQSLITPTRIKEYGFQSYYQPKILNNPLFGYRRNPQQGLSYLRYLSGMLKKKLIDYPVHLADKWIFFAFLQKIISSQILRQTKKFDPRFQKIPIPLQLGLSCSKGILLIGPVETGRSYLIKNLAADSSVPLLGISMNKLLYNKPDVITESWMNILIQSLRRSNLILDLAKGMSPCIIWIRDIHQLDVDRPTQNIESDPTFLLGILLKHFQTDSLEAQTRNKIIVVGSTHVPKKVDPSLISPNRLDRVLNIRLLDTYRRKTQFPILLNKNGLQSNKNLLYFNEFGSRTMGYNIRDLAALTNEISLISITRNKSFVHRDILKLAFHRQVFGFGHTSNRLNYQQNFKILLYKIGRAIIQNILVEGSATNPLNISNCLWKRKFYYLSKWYSESPMDDPIIKESTVLVHVLGSSAGIAARDSWFVLEKDSDISISLNKSVGNDLDLAFGLLETFSSDFTWLETCKNKFLDYRKKKPRMFLTKNLLNTMHNGIFAIANKSIINNQNESQYESLLSGGDIIDREIGEFNNTAWSPRFWRLSFSRNHLFNWIKRPSDFGFSHTFGFSDRNNLETPPQNYRLTSDKKEPLFYERILPRVRKRNVEELESQFENILLEEHSEILGFFSSSTQYQMEYQMENKPRLFIGKRILWNPIGSFSQIRHFVFSRREFFVDEEMLRRLYITYGVRRERERSPSSHRIRRFFICRGYTKDLINKLSVRWWNELPMDQKQNIYTLGQIEKMGIRLKRPQIFTPVYLYQRWLIENIPGKFSRLNLSTHRARWLKINTLLLNDSLTYKILLESYQYLFEFFLSNKRLLNRMTGILLNKKWIFQSEIRDIIRHIKTTEFW